MELDHVFGLRSDLHGNVVYLDETTVAYPCGHVVVLYNLETKLQRFIQGSDWSGGICAVATSPNRKLIAVAERTAECPIVSIYDAASLKKRKVLSCSDMRSGDLVNIAFSGDSKQLLAQGHSPDWLAMIWVWEKNKCIVTSKTSNVQGNAITFTDFCPWDSNTLCVIGDGILKFLRVQDGATRALPFSFKREIQQYICHTWLKETERLVVATDTGDLLLFENFEFRGTLAFVQQDDDSLDMLPIDSLAAYNKGLVCGGAHNTLRIFEQTDDPHEYYRHTKTFSIEGKSSRVINLALSPSEDNIACSLANNQVYVLGLSNTDILKAEEMNFELLTTSVHGPFIHEAGMAATATGAAAAAAAEDAGSGSQVTGLDVCMRKPYVASCGIDRTVRVWNYLEKTVVLMREFSEVPLSLSFHPSGLHLLVGFSDKLRLMNLLMDDIRTYKEFPIKACKECRFSNGGQYFAAANGNVVQVFQTYTFECILTLRGHAGRVLSVNWTQDDRVLVSAGADGVLYRWCIKEGRKDGEYVCKGNVLQNTVPRDVDANVAICTASPDAKIKEVQLGNGSILFEAAPPEGLSFERLAISNSGRSLFATMIPPGDAKYGTMVMLSLPLSTNHIAPSAGAQGGAEGGKSGDGELAVSGSASVVAGDEPASPSGAGAYGAAAALGGTAGDRPTPECLSLVLDQLKHIAVHAGRITRVCVSPDDQYLFTCGEDGTLAMFTVKEEPEAGRGARNNREKEAPLAFAEEILVTKSDLEEKNNLMQDLKNKVDELTLHNEYQLRLKDMNYNERIKEVTTKFSEELDQDRAKYDKLSTEKQSMENMFKERLEKLEQQHSDQLETVERAYQEKVDAEMQRFDALSQEREQMALKWDEENQVLVESHEKYVNEVTDEYEKKLARELNEREEIEEEKQRLVKSFEDRKQEVEEDADMEIEELKERYETKLKSEREATIRLKGENGLMKKKFRTLQNDIEQQKDEIKNLSEREMDLYERIKSLEKDIQGHKKEIKERDETIQDKEKRIYDLKKKNQELEKFKFVLDYKIKELKRQIEPRENEIADMRQQIKEMDLELEQYQKSNAALDLMIGELRLKIDGMQKEIDEQTKKLRDAKSAAEQCKVDLHEAINSLNDPVALKQRIVQMFKTYAQAPDRESSTTSGGTSGPDDAAGGADGGAGGEQQQEATTQVQKEYNRQREYLEKSVDSLKRKLNKDMKMHQNDKMRLLRESVDLTNEINVLRRELHVLDTKRHAKQRSLLLSDHHSYASGNSDAGMPMVLSTPSFGSSNNQVDSPMAGSPSGVLPPSGERQVSRELEMQRKQISHLLQQIATYEQNLGLK